MADRRQRPRTQTSQQDDRRQGAPPAPVFGELLLEAKWGPEGPVAPEVEGWLRTRESAFDRRKGT